MSNPIEPPDRTGHRPFRPPEPPQKEEGARSRLLGIFHRFLSALDEEGSAKPTHRSIRETLEALAGVLRSMIDGDMSENAPFLHRFSSLWRQALTDLRGLLPGSTAAKNIQSWMDTVASYPEGAQYTLGYYLLESAGERWLPFPYIDLIRSLHKENITLQKWLTSLEELIEKV